MAAPAIPAKKVARDPVAVDAKHYKVEFENDKVRVLRIKYGPHEKSPMHSHPPLVAVFLTPHHSRHVFSDGEVKEIRGKAGEVMYMDRTEHEPENAGDAPFELIGIELKS
ncbi:MAG TPA: hypothetical protein VMD58_06835 [Acidobacteriaceae bacterium]|nr:hypothetical protein [Acidobacteriaceae bacterium]